MRPSKPIRHTLEHWAVWAFAAKMRILPRPMAMVMGALVGELGWWSRIRRGIVLGNLAQALPELGERERRRLAARAARNFGRTLVEFLRFGGRRQSQLSELIDLEGLDALERALEEGRGALVVSGHLGAWALYVNALSTRGIPVTLLVGRQHNPKVDKFILDLPGETVELVSKGPGAPRGVLRSLKAGKAVVLIADHNAGTKGTFVPFLGKTASTLPLPGALVARHHVALFLMMGHRVPGGRHRVCVRRLNVPENDSEELLRREITVLLNQAIGEAVLEHPDQYFWYHRRWRDYPQSAGSAATPGGDPLPTRRLSSPTLER